MDTKTIANVEVCLLAKEAGYNLWSEFSYSRYSEITEYARKKYGELSDDGYYELSVEGGGSEPFEKIYDKEYQLTRYQGNNSYFEDCGMSDRCVSAVSVYEIQRWLREEKGIILQISYLKDTGNWFYEIIVPDMHACTDFRKPVRDYYQNINDGLKCALKFCIKHSVL